MLKQGLASSVLVLPLVGLLLFGVSCTKKSNNDKIFVFCAEGSPSAFNPQIATDGATFNATHAIYSRLVEFEYGATTVIPSLAVSWESSANGKEYVFKLRKGVKFHSNDAFQPTRDFNADDVVFTFKRQHDKNHPYHKVSGGVYEYFQSMDMGSIIKDIVKVNDHTVKFILNKVEAPFVANLAMDFASILSKEYADQMLAAGTPEKIDNMPIGTGAFVFNSYSKDLLIRYTAFDDYFNGRVKLDRLIFSITPDASVRFQKLKAGECHLVPYPAPADLEAMRQSEDINLIDQAGFNVGYLAMNVTKPPFDSLKVRQAVNHALNKESYIRAVYLNNAVVAKNPMPPTIWSYNDEVKDYEYSVQKAKALLKEAGHENGFDTDLWTLPVSRPYIPAGKQLGEMMQADLKAVGINAKLVTNDWPTYLARSKNGEHQMLQLGWTGDNGDPDNFLYTLLSCAAKKGGSNRASWCFEPFDKLVKQAKEITNQNERISKYKQAQVIFKEQAPWVTIAHSTVYRATRKNVKGYKIDPLGRDIFEYISLE